MIDLNELAIFSTVAQLGSFTKAATKLDIPLSSLSRKVTQLEKRLGTQLLLRTTRQLQLTDHGKEYFIHCQRMLESAEAAEFAVRQLQSEPSGTLRLHTPFSADINFAGLFISSFLKAYPKINIEMFVQSRPVNLIEEGFDCGFAKGPLPDSTLVQRSFGSVSSKFYASPEYLKNHGTPKTLEELNRHQLIGAESFDWSLEGPEGKVEMDPFYHISINDMIMVKQMTVDGCGISLLPSPYSQAAESRGSLVPVLPAYSQTINLYIVYPSNNQVSNKLRCFLDHAVKLYQQEQPWS